MGDTMTSAEYVAICARIFGKRRPRGPPHLVLEKLIAFAPLRFDFELARQRGKAFDSGEAGFKMEIMR
jgi:hypothetical protein